MWVCRLPVHIGPRGSCDFAEDHHNTGLFWRADRGVRHYRECEWAL